MKVPFIFRVWDFTLKYQFIISQLESNEFLGEILEFFTFVFLCCFLPPFTGTNNLFLKRKGTNKVIIDCSKTFIKAAYRL